MQASTPLSETDMWGRDAPCHLHPIQSLGAKHSFAQEDCAVSAAGGRHTDDSDGCRNLCNLCGLQNQGPPPWLPFEAVNQDSHAGSLPTASEKLLSWARSLALKRKQKSRLGIWVPQSRLNFREASDWFLRAAASPPKLWKAPVHGMSTTYPQS